jgi:hypothetical protein
VNDEAYIVFPCSHGRTVNHIIGEPRYGRQGAPYCREVRTLQPLTLVSELSTQRLLALRGFVDDVAVLVAAELEARTGERV